MKEIRIHGRGGQGVVKAAQLVVQSVVDMGGYAHFIPFFGVERKGSPVYGFLRINDADIRIKCQVYEPDVLLIFDDSLLGAPQTFEGLRDGSVIIINTNKRLDALKLPPNAGTVGLVDATKIALEILELNVPNTAMLGAFAKVTGLVDWQSLCEHVDVMFGAKNRNAVQCAYDNTVITKLQEV
ncbi:MAG: 2-oxoacid:acceptor oxidoreductase family protein [Deltaproteobacteria bacterium]|nr:2-oxoacid:acceptor oxidoreductase family protein [Deltaproteobacteria bacterium]